MGKTTRRTGEEAIRRFVEAYMGPACGNGVKACEIAKVGGRTANSRAVYSSRVLSKAKTQVMLAARQAGDPKIADRAERQAFFSTVMRDREEATLNRLKAGELLGKMGGDFVTRVEIQDPDGELAKLCGVSKGDLPKC